MSSLAFAIEMDWLSKHLTLLANDIGNAIGQKRGAPPAGDHKGIESRKFGDAHAKACSPVASKKARAASSADAASRRPQGGLLLAPSGPKN